MGFHKLGIYLHEWTASELGIIIWSKSLVGEREIFPVLNVDIIIWSKSLVVKTLDNIII